MCIRGVLSIQSLLSVLCVVGLIRLAHAQPDQALAVSEPIEIRIAGYGGNDIFAMNNLVKQVLAQEFAALGVKVSYFAVESDYPKYMLNALSSGHAPDAFYLNSDVAQAWIASGKLAAFPPAFAAIAAQFHPTLIDIYQREQSLYALPKDVNTLALQFNRDIFDDAGVAYPSSDDTWLTFEDKLRQVTQALADEGVYGLCITPDFSRFAPFALATGWQAFDANGHTRLDARFVRAFRFYTGLVTQGLAVLPADLGQQWGGGCFGTERAAVAIEGNWIGGFLQDKSPNLLYQSVLLPRDPDTQARGNLLFTAGWAMSGATQYPQQVAAVIQALTSEKAQLAIMQAGLALPSRVNASAEFQQAQIDYVSQGGSKQQLSGALLRAANVEHVMAYAFGDAGAAWMEPIQVALSSVMLGELSVDAAIAEAQIRYERMQQVQVKPEVAP